MVKLVVESVPPVYPCCDTLLTAADIASASRFQNEARRNEHLAWRRIVRRELGRDVAIEYNTTGAPEVNSEGCYISVSHSRGVVAVAFGEEPVGVDIETMERDFGRASARYLSDEERALSGEQSWAARVWTAKEAMYKLYGQRGVELLDDLRITAYNPETGLLNGVISGRHRVKVTTSIEREEYIVAVATMDNDEG